MYIRCIYFWCQLYYYFELTLSYVYLGASVQIIRWSSLSSMKNCSCCMEVERCRERMAEVEKDDECVTLHPGF